MPTPPESPYARPLIYDILHAHGSLAEARHIVRIARTLVQTSRTRPLRVLEPACGTGRFLLALASLGHTCVGVDLDTGMAEFARQRARSVGLARRVRVHVGDMRTMDHAIGSAPPSSARFDLAFCPDNSIRHLASDRDCVNHIRSTLALLRPGGVYLVGIGLLDDLGEDPVEQVWHARRGTTTVRQVIEFIPPDASTVARGGRVARRETALSVISVSTPRSEEDIATRYTLRSYTLDQWRAVVRRAGAREVAVATADGRRVTRHASTRRAYAFRALVAADR